MDTLLTATIVGFLVLLASLVSVELGISVAIIEIAFGVVAGNALGVTTTPWIDFLASFASMSTGLTFGTISSLYGLSVGIIDRTQFSVLVTAVILSAVVPTVIAQRWFSPPMHTLSAAEVVDVEDEEFEPPHRIAPVGDGRSVR